MTTEEPEAPERRVRITIPERAAMGRPPKETLLELESLSKIALAPGFMADVFVQGKAAVLLAEGWNYMPRKKQDAYIDLFSKAFTRCRDTPGNSGAPADCLRKIVALRSQEDIRRALMVPVLAEPHFELDGGEGIYPTEGWLGEYLSYACRNEVPLGFHFWSAVAVLGAMCHRNFYVEFGAFRLYMNNYVMLTGDQASGKSLAKDVAVDVLRRYNDLLEVVNPKDPRIVHVLPEDITAEFIVTEMASRRVSEMDLNSHIQVERMSDSTAFAPIDELATFLSKDAWAIRKRVPLLTTLWSYEGKYRKGTKKEGIEELQNIALTILTCCAPEWFRENITDDVRQGGFMDRALFIHREPPNRCYPWPYPLDPLVAERLARVLHGRMHQTDKLILRGTKKANDWYESWYREAWERERDRGRNAKSVRTVKRQGMHLWKLAGILCIAYNELPDIKTERMVEAQRILEFEEQFLAVLFELIEERPDAPVWDKIVDFVRDQGGCVTRTQMTQRFKKHKWMGDAKTILKYVDSLVEGEVLDSYKDGRKVYYRLPGHSGCVKCGGKQSEE